MSYETIKVEEKSGGEITEITLGPAPANLLSAKMMKEIETQLELEEKIPHKKLIIFSGEGKHFCFGAVVEEHKPELVNEMLPGLHRLIGRIIDCKIPTLAKVTGVCLGGGFELVLACTFIFSDDTGKFGVPEITLGVFPPVASCILPLRCPDPISSQIILTGEHFKAKDLQKYGLVNQVVEKGLLDDAVSDFFEKQIKPKSAMSLRLASQAARLRLSEEYHRSISKQESLYLKDLMATNDANEGIMAFLEKRAPEWKNE